MLIVVLQQLFQPSSISAPWLILFARDLNARLNLTDRYGRDMQILVSYASEPSENCAMRPNPAQFRYNIRIEEIHRRQTILRSLRRRLPPRRGTFSSPRAPFANSNSLSVGLAARFSLCQSVTGTRTAASAPRLVTNCGPSLRQVSSISLNRAFAS